MRPIIALALCAAAPTAVGMMYDVVQPHLLPPPGGCKPWSAVPEMDEWWLDGKPPENAGASCAQQAKGNPQAPWKGSSPHDSGSVGHALGAYCVSATSGKIESCTSPMSTPEQVNVQIASGDSVVISFVTFEPHPPTAPPVANLSAEGAAESVAKGVSHKHVTVGGRVYWMHFIRASGLRPSTEYEYSVAANGGSGRWSDRFSFRSPKPIGEGPTRVALYGDMGVCE